MAIHNDTDKFKYFDASGKHRYLLTRNLLPDSNKTVLFIMLNPSKANEEDNDPTIKRCMDFARLWGYGLLKVVNLFSYIETDADKLKEHPQCELFDDKTNEYIKDSVIGSDKIIVAWGNNVIKIGVDRVLELAEMIKGKSVFCLSKNKSGQPKHPLYAKKINESELIEWSR